MGIRLTARDRKMVAEAISASPESYEAAHIRDELARVRTRLVAFDASRAARGKAEAAADGDYYFSPTRITELLLNNFESIADDVVQLAVHDRISDDDPALLVRGVFTAGRLKYLVNANREPSYSDGWDCLHVLDVVDSLAVPDEPLIAAYLKALPGPARTGHSFTVLYANAVYALLGDDTTRVKAVADELARTVERASLPDIDRAILSVLLGIARGDVPYITSSLTRVLDGHRRQEYLRRPGLLSLVSLTAHGLYRLAERFLGAPAELRPPVHRNWDGEFHDAVDRGRPEFLDTVLGVDPMVETWLTELPERIAGSTLLEAALYQRLATGLRELASGSGPRRDG